MTEQFIQQRVYLNGVSPRTVDWYRCAFRAFDGALESKQTIIGRIARLKEGGASHITINSYMRCINAYFRWNHIENGKELVKIPKLKEEQKIRQTLSADNVRALIGWKGVGVNLKRAHLAALVILDCGLRASEVLGLTRKEINLDALTIQVLGKGGKHRLVPFGIELRKSLFRYLSKSTTRFVFGTKNDTKVSVHNLDRDFKVIGKRIGVHLHPHLLRHTMATNWIRRGGDLFQLSRCLGHSNISTTALYLKSLGIEDMAATSQRVSLLSSSR